MSRAFVKDDDTGPGEELPDREISPHPNFVTAKGLAAIEAAIARLREELIAAHQAEDRDASARIGRDLRYWMARRGSAQLVEPANDKEKVHFGSTITIEREDGRRQTFQIVGEDEADPAHGTVSYVSPLAQALMGKERNDTALVGTSDVEIIEVA